jgi:hypothetical protein
MKQIVVKLHGEFSNGLNDEITAYSPVNIKWLPLS